MWANHLDASNDDRGYAIAVDALGNVYTTGYFNGGNDVFVSINDGSGNTGWTGTMGGVASSEYGSSIAVDLSGNIYTAGDFDVGGDFDPGLGTLTLTSAGSHDIFVQKMSQIVTGIKGEAEINNIIIYPNPTTGSVNVAVSKPENNVLIEIYNSWGF